MSGDQYNPIDCGLYSEYEVAILYRRALQLQWRDYDGEEHSEPVMPHDLQTRDGCEYLLGKLSSGALVVIRLDHIFSRTEELL